jgi:hypothetical protein
MAAAAWMPCSAATVLDGMTAALPPPPYIGCGEAAGPMTAIDRCLELGGSVPPLFLSSTADWSTP